MQYGDLVAPLFLADPGWRFVTGDTHDIARRVHDEFSDTRIVGRPETGHLAVAVWVPRSKMGKTMTDDSVKQSVQPAGGAWVLSFRLMQNDQPRHTLEADVLEELRRKDTHRRLRGVDPRKLYNELEAAHERRQERAVLSMSEYNRAVIEEQLYAWSRSQRVPWNPARIYVPARANGDNR